MINLPEEHKEPDYEKAELDLLRDALKKTHEERFFTLTKLMKQGIMLKNAKVIHKPLKASIKRVYKWTFTMKNLFTSDQPCIISR